MISLVSIYRKKDCIHTHSHNSFIKKDHYHTNYNYPLKRPIVHYDEYKCAYLHVEDVTNKMQHQVCFLVWVSSGSPHGSLEWGWYTNIQINFHAYQKLDTLPQGPFLTKPNKKYCIRTVPHFSFLLTFTCPYHALFGNKFCVPVENVNNSIVSTQSQENSTI